MSNRASDPHAGLRRDYAVGGLAESDLAADPFAMFQRWYDDAVAAGLYEPNAMVVASVSADGRPSARMVLMKGFSPDGWVFFTNLGSRKGIELLGNAHCALLFPWHPLERQVRIDGVATELRRAEVNAYFATRPRNARLGAHASHQSQEVASRAMLDEAWAAADASYPDEVPVPDEWGGFRVVPDAVEFWQGRPGRMHDRLVYRRTQESAAAASASTTAAAAYTTAAAWTTHRLAP